jgi:hypothetical protein
MINKYIQTYESKNIKEAEEWLKNNDFVYYIYFESPFMVYYLGFDNLNKAKQQYNIIIKKIGYGCVVSIRDLY